jgi:hypothetical protein
MPDGFLDGSCFSKRFLAAPIARKFRWNAALGELWHLATAMTLKREFPELRLLTFDQRLKTAAEIEIMG